MSSQSDYRALGLTDDEYEMILATLGRPPSEVELAMYAVMWSEHCSYKSSRKHLGRLPTEGPQVLVGPGENAGVVDVGDGVAIALRIESHNHPSFIEPYQGAATGIGGILRDIFAVGARPIALMDPLFVGPLEEPHSRYILDGIVRGIAGYGNSVGVPTIGGSLTIDPSYRGNPLVNVFCLGVLPIERLVLGAASGVGNLAVLLGSRTGRDGIGGVSVLASAGFDEESSTKRPSVQVGDPYEEKRLIEACLALLDEGLVVGIQDLGGAGLACATCETAARAGLGMEVDVDAVPRREPGMNAVEVMTSESQERMLAIVSPDDIEACLAVCRRWEVEAAVVGRVVEPDSDGVGRLRVRASGGSELLAEVPAASLADEAPLYDRPIAPPADLAERRRHDPGLLEPPIDCGEDLLALLVDPSWIYEQYDHQLFLNTVLGPGEADATLLRLAGPGVPWSGKGLALSCDANPGWCAIDPRAGTAATVAESALNVSCAGARPLAVVNCLNFGNPEHPEVMWELIEAIEGMRTACEALGIPVVGGNVSLYNESGGEDIDPTPVVAVAGLLDQLTRRPPAIGWADGDDLVLLGSHSSALGGSRWARTLRGEPGGELFELDLAAHGRLAELVRSLVAAECGPFPRPGLIHGIHHVADGGLAVALGECAVAAASGCVLGAGLTFAELFAEAPDRVLVATGDGPELIARAKAAGVDASILGTAGGSRLMIEGLVDLAVEAIAAATSRRLRDALRGDRGELNLKWAGARVPSRIYAGRDARLPGEKEPEMDTAVQGATAGVIDGSRAMLFSADSHVVEETTLWHGILPDEFFAQYDLSEVHKRPGRVDPVARLEEMAIDGVNGEVLYPSLALKLFGLEDAEVQRQCFRRYNEWLSGFCATAPDKLIGVGLISCYDIPSAIDEIERCAAAGLRGCEVWQSPDPRFPFSGEHYDPLWAAAERLGLPVSLHILTGYKAGLSGQGLPQGGSDSVVAAIAQYRVSVNLKLLGVTDTLLEIMFSGTMDRFPGLQFVVVENEIGWMPFVLDQYDYYVERFRETRPSAMEKLPSQYFGSQLFATFFRDPVGMAMFGWWGGDGAMWSSDYPHGNSTWPNSQQVVEDNLGYLPDDIRNKIVRGNARRLYRLDD